MLQREGGSGIVSERKRARGGAPEEKGGAAKELEALNLSILALQGLNIEIDWFRRLASRQVPNETLHSHSGIEFHFVLEGANEVSFSEESYTVRAGEMILIPKGKIHRLANPGGEEYLRYALSVSLGLSDSDEGQFLGDALSVPRPVVMKISPAVRDMLRRCQEESENAVAGCASMIELTLLQLLFSIARELTGFPKEVKNRPEKITASKQLADRIVGYIERNVCESITVNDISEFMHMSSKHIQRIIQREYKCTVKEMVIRLRLQLAKNYLKNTQMNISEISEMLGFSSEQSFCRFYRSADGQSPTQYRKGFLGVR